jgi:hypothetical protein
MGSFAAADRLLRRGLWALLAMWILGLVSTLYLYVQPFLYVEIMGFRPPCAGIYPVWSTDGPRVVAFVRAAPLLIGGLVLPLVWHRRALARLSRHTRAVLDPGRPGRYREPPGTLLRPAVPELAARAAVLRYAGRLAIALALLLPVYFMAANEGTFPLCYRYCYQVQVTVPTAIEYLPLLALSTLLVAFHVPTRARVLGALGPWWAASRAGGSHPRP